MALGRKDVNQTGREGVFADVRNVGGYGGKAAARLVLCPNNHQPSVPLMTLEYGQRQNRKDVRRNIARMKCQHREMYNMSATNNHSCLSATAIMCLVFIFMSTAFTQLYASVIIMTKEEVELDKIFDKKLEELTPNIVAEGMLGNNGEILLINRKKNFYEGSTYENIFVVDNKDKTLSLYYIKWPIVHSYGKINKNGKIDYLHVDGLDFANSKSFSGPKKWPKRCGESIKISELVGEKDWIMITSKPYIIFHIPKNTIGFMYELYNGKLFYPGSNAKMIKTSSLCYVVQTNKKKIEIKRCIDNTNICIIENADDFRPSEITWIDAGKGPWRNGVWPYMEKQNLPVMPDRMLFLSPDNNIIESKYEYINEHGDKIDILQSIPR